MAKMTCTAVGDMILQRRLPLGPEGYEGFAAVRDYIRAAEFRFGNLETTVHCYECPPTEIGGGGYLCAAPETLDIVKAFGLNALNTGNNHTLDFTQDGAVKTLEYLDLAGLAHAGSGRNLAEAAQPVYLDLPGGRYALIGMATVYREYEMAGEQTKNMMGRPGLNGLRYQTEYHVTAQQMQVLKEIAEQTGMNGAKDISRKEGFSPALREKEFWFGGLSFFEDEAPCRITRMDKRDFARVKDAIEEARYLADYVIVSLHSHDLEGEKKENPDMYLREFARAVIDAGADAVIGHGPHLLRPVEIYQGKPIFYSLGNFILMNLNLPRSPKQQFEKYGLEPSANMAALYRAVTANETRGLHNDPRMMQAVIPYWEAENGRLTKLRFLPVELGYGLPARSCGWPRFVPDCGALEFLKEISAPYGTEIIIKDGMGEAVL